MGDDRHSEQASGFTIFCDDIRAEADGRHTYVGVFEVAAGVQSFPAVLPKLGLAITYRQPKELAPVPVQLKVLFEPESEGEVARELLRADIDVAEALANVVQPGPYLAAVAHVILSPLQIPFAGVMKVRAYAEGREPTKLGAMLFKLQSDIGPSYVPPDAKAIVTPLSRRPT